MRRDRRLLWSFLNAVSCGAHKENRGKVCQEQREILAVIRLDLERQPVPGSVVISFPTCQGLV